MRGFSLSCALGLALVAGLPQNLRADPGFAITYPKDQKFGSPLVTDDFKIIAPKRRVVAPIVSPIEMTRAPASVEEIPEEIPAEVPQQKFILRPLPAPRPPTPVKTAARDPASGVFDPIDTIQTAQRFSAFDLSPHFFFTRIDGTDRINGGTSVLLSNINMGASFAWSQTWSDSTRSFIGIDLSKLGFKTTNTTAVEGASQYYTQILAGVQHAPFNWLDLELSGGASEEVFIRASSTNIINVDKIMVPEIHTSLTFNVITLYPFLIGTQLSGSMLFSSSTETHKVSDGYGYRAKIFLVESTETEAVRWSGSLFYGQTFQNTSINKQQRKDVGLEIGLRWGGPHE
ncbi:MAG: hypothetical protein ABIR96_12605 [Bdellovibrionota bacterium]